jgi:formate dehydrogenase alpha subunit
VGTGREFELKKTLTTCSFCSLGCSLTLGEKDGKVVYVTSPANSPNEANLCVKGRYGWPYIYSEKRLTRPMIQKGGSLVEVDWNEGLGFVAQRFNEIKMASGSASLAALGSARLTNEEAYVFNRFVRTVLETPHLDHAGGFAYRPLTDGIGRALGYPASANSVREIRKADVILLFGADLTESHPVAKNEVIVAHARNRAKVIVVDSLKTKLTDCSGSIFLPVPPDNEYLVANAMLKWVIDQGLYDRKALDLQADGFDELSTSLSEYTPENVAKLTRLNPNLIVTAAKAYCEATNATIIVTTGMNRSANSVELAQAAANLALVTGRAGKRFSGIHVFGEKTNSQGALDMGLGPDLLPGFKRMEDKSDRAIFAAAWDAPIPETRGLDARGILVAAEKGEIKGLYVVGENPVETYPDRNHVEKALANLEFLVVQDMFLTSTARMAHAVIPVAAFSEKAGTYTSADRRVQRLGPSTKKPVTKSDLEVFIALAAVMGKPSMTYAGPQPVMEEIAELVDVYRGISYNRLGDQGLVWPCVDPQDPGKEILYEGGFPGGKAHLIPAPPLSWPGEEPHRLGLIPGVLKFHSGSMSQESFSLLEVCPEGFAEMSRRDLELVGARDGDTVKLTIADGSSIHVKAKRSWRAVEGTVIVPYHFSDVKLNRLIRWDQPVASVRVEKA